MVSELSSIHTNHSSIVIQSITNQDYEIPISVWTNKTDARIYLCDGKNHSTSNCLEIILTDGSTKNEINKCKKGKTEATVKPIVKKNCTNLASTQVNKMSGDI